MPNQQICTAYSFLHYPRKISFSVNLQTSCLIQALLWTWRYFFATLHKMQCWLIVSYFHCKNKLCFVYKLFRYLQAHRSRTLFQNALMLVSIMQIARWYLQYWATTMAFHNSWVVHLVHFIVFKSSVVKAWEVIVNCNVIRLQGVPLSFLTF